MAKLGKVSVIFRKARYQDGTEEIIAFFCDKPATYGNILSYVHIGQHCEISLEFYRDTKPATEKEYAELFSEITSIYDDCELVVRKRINYNALLENWR